jgi:2-polyprenyl-3-methyl-5-hydroxy-6-metoxy-1,4-benzoquinol methylase
MTTPSILDQVRDKYAAVARSGLSSDHAGVSAVAQAFGYTPEELATIPADANLGLSCGNPTAFASLRPGETVVDLGCGGGLDVLLASAKVGPTGKVIGIDMTSEMVDLARRNAARQGVENAEFHLTTIDKLPLPDGSVDCIISNCVLNLVPDKLAVFREMYRVLKPGGRVAVSDIALKKPLPAEVARDVMAYVGCIAGAIPIADYVAGLTAAGFDAVRVVDTERDLNAYAAVDGQGGCCSPAMTDVAATTGCCTPAPPGSTACCTPKVEAQAVHSAPEPAAACCTPAPSGSSACCTPNLEPEAASVHGGLAELLNTHNVNEFAASVQIDAIKASVPSLA